MYADFFSRSCETDRIYTTDRRTVTEADHINFMTSYGFFESFFMDHSDQESNTHFAGRVVPGALTFCLSEGLTIFVGHPARDRHGVSGGRAEGP